MTVFEHAGRLLIVDCGVLFPEEHQPGVDVILPDFTWIRDRLDKVVAHRADARPRGPHRRRALPAARARRTSRVVGSQARRWRCIEAKLKEHRITPAAARGRARATSATSARSTCEFLAVNHSIPDGLAVAIRTAAGLVLHTGDFKMDQFPLDDRITDLRGFARLGEEGVDLFLTDSTNAEVPGFTTAERDLAPGHRDRSSAPRRAGSSSPASPATCTASSRCSTPPTQHGRKVAFVGRSMVRNMGIAQDLGYLKVPQGLDRRRSSSSRSCRPTRSTLICTGSQGEPMAALSRMANRDHMIRVGEGDTVLMASSVIPGNENAISGVINGLTRWGANVVHKGNAKVHVSGHASAGELVYCYNIVQPSNVMPVHGEWRHLRANADLAITHRRRPPTTSSSPRTASSSTWSTGTRKITGKVPAGNVYVDAQTVGGATEATLKDRRTLAEEGVVTVLAIVDADTGKLAEPPDFLVRGFVHDERHLRRRRPGDREDARARPPPRASATPTSSSRCSRRDVGRWAAAHVPPQPADHPDRHRRLSPRAGTNGPARRPAAADPVGMTAQGRHRRAARPRSAHPSERDEQHRRARRPGWRR